MRLSQKSDIENGSGLSTTRHVRRWDVARRAPSAFGTSPRGGGKWEAQSDISPCGGRGNAGSVRARRLRWNRRDSRGKRGNDEVKPWNDDWYAIQTEVFCSSSGFWSDCPDTLQPVTWSLALRDGFAWWLPILAAAVAALIAVMASQSSVDAWDADVHLWAREGRTASEYAALVMDRSVQESATSGMLASADGLPELDGVAVNVTDTLIRVTVRASRPSDAEALALSLAHAAVDEAYVRYGDEAGLDLLGLVRPGARQVSPATGWTAAWASAIGLAAGLAFAWVFARRQSSGPSTALGRMGRIGLKPLAVVSAEAEHTAGQATGQATGQAGPQVVRADGLGHPGARIGPG